MNLAMKITKNLVKSKPYGQRTAIIQFHRGSRNDAEIFYLIISDH